MSIGGDAADHLVQMELQITERALKLAGLGAKNLVALLVALLQHQDQLKGKTNINHILSERDPISVLPIKQKDLKQFTKEANQYGLLFTPVVHKKDDRGICDIIIRAKDAGTFGKIMEAMKYPVPGRENEEKYAPPRALPGNESNERGNGLQQQTADMLTNEARQQIKKPRQENSIRQRIADIIAPKKSAPPSPVPVIQQQKERPPAMETRPAQQKPGSFLEQLSPEVLAALVLAVSEQMKDISPVARLFSEKTPIQVMSVSLTKKEAATLSEKAQALALPLSIQPGEKGKHQIIARVEDAAQVNALFQQLGHGPPMTEPAREPAKRGRPRKDRQESEKSSVKQQIKDTKQAPGSGEKSAPEKAPATPAKSTRAPKKTASKER